VAGCAFVVILLQMKALVHKMSYPRRERGFTDRCSQVAPALMGARSFTRNQL